MSKRYVHNNLKVLQIDDDELSRLRPRLQRAALTGIHKIEQELSRASIKDTGIYIGVTGIAVMFIRCAIQHYALGLSKMDAQTLFHKAKALLDAAGPIDTGRIHPGRLSPLGSPLGVAVVRILYSLVAPGAAVAHSADVAVLEHAIRAAKEDESDENEVLYGRAGLLYALCELRGLLTPSDVQSHQQLVQLTSDATLRDLCSCIIRDGMGTTVNNDEPLRFEWNGTYYLGAIHGTAGILTVLLQCPESVIRPYKSKIIATVRHLASLVSDNGGDLPPSLPALHDAHRLVQICHGSPGYILLMVALKSMRPEWAQELGQLVDDTLEQATNATWERGLLIKGLGFCHGITGNAWPWLLLEHATPSSANDPNSVLGRAAAFLLQAMEAPPLSSSSIYRTPDHPYSLFEGLAGAVCCWVEACAVISSRLGEGGIVLGLPGIGGLRK